MKTFIEVGANSGQDSIKYLSDGDTFLYAFESIEQYVLTLDGERLGRCLCNACLIGSIVLFKGFIYLYI